MLGNNRVTRWLSTMCKVSYDDETFGFSLQIFWKNIHKFSSKKLSIQNKMEEETQAKWNNVDGKQNKQFNCNFTASWTGKTKCSFCNELKEHLEINVPKETNIIQYFACQEFSEMAPFERYQELKSNCFCIQYLFDGAMQNSGKHNDTKC